MKEHKGWKIKDGSTEVPARFHGQEIVYSKPSTADELRSIIDRAVEKHNKAHADKQVTRDDVVYGLAMNQGYNLNVQKRVKDILDSDAVKELGVAEAIAYAVKTANDEEAGARIPGTTRGEGRASKVKAAEAKAARSEAKVADLTEQLRLAYTSMAKNARATWAAGLLEKGLVTQEQLDEWSA